MCVGGKGVQQEIGGTGGRDFISPYNENLKITVKITQILVFLVCFFFMLLVSLFLNNFRKGQTFPSTWNFYLTHSRANQSTLSNHDRNPEAPQIFASPWRRCGVQGKGAGRKGQGRPKGHTRATWTAMRVSEGHSRGLNTLWARTPER